MPSLNIDLNFSRHPKVIRTKVMLPDPFEADHFFQSLMRLWEYVGSFHAAGGDLSEYSDAEIEATAGWRGNAGKFLRVGLERKWLDKDENGYSIHDWLDWESHICVYHERAKAAASIRHGKRPAKRKSAVTQPLNHHASSSAKSEGGQCLTTALHCTALHVLKEDCQGEIKPPWTRPEFDAAAKNIGPDAIAVADALWGHLDSQGWEWGNGIKVQGDPRSAFVRWLSKPERNQKVPSGATGNGHREAWKIEADIKTLKLAVTKTTTRIDACRAGSGILTDSEWIEKWRQYAKPEDVQLREQQRTRLKELEIELQGAI